jgi:rubrerythrin
MVMETEWTLERVLKLALKTEEESIQLYKSAIDKVTKHPGSKEFLMELVTEEEKHKEKILQIIQDFSKLGEIGKLESTIHNLKIVDYLEDVTISPEADYQQILIYAGKREKNTHDFYMWFAKRYQGTKIGYLFKKLAQEELKHKYRLEIEYDDTILKTM